MMPAAFASTISLPTCPRAPNTYDRFPKSSCPSVQILQGVRQIAHFARSHKSYEYVLYAQPNSNEAERLEDLISSALTYGGAKPSIRRNIVLPTNISRIDLLTPTVNSGTFSALYASLHNIDSFTYWAKVSTMPTNEIYILIGGRF